MILIHFRSCILSRGKHNHRSNIGDELNSFDFHNERTGD